MTAAWLIRGDARMLPLADKSVQCVVTSPPYFGLRSYGGQMSVWGGDQACSHSLEDDPARRAMTGGTGPASAKQVTNNGSQFGNAWVDIKTSVNNRHAMAIAAGLEGGNGVGGSANSHVWSQVTQTCSICGAWHGELGSEPTPALFVSHLVEVFRECWRVLRDDGVCFLNIGDSYAGSGKGPGNQANGKETQSARQGFVNQVSGGRPKSLLLVPERLAIALSDDGWIIRSRIAWCKAAPMPESVRDRPTSAWEHIWMLSKSGRYYWDQEAVRRPSNDLRTGEDRIGPNSSLRNVAEREVETGLYRNGTSQSGLLGIEPNPAGANMRNYWVLPPDPYPGSHFATFPREIPRRCILAASREGDVVLDPFSGSGTTAFVAASLGRRGVGVELSADYIQQARYGRLAQDFLPLVSL